MIVGSMVGFVFLVVLAWFVYRWANNDKPRFNPLDDELDRIRNPKPILRGLDENRENVFVESDNPNENDDLDGSGILSEIQWLSGIWKTQNFDDWRTDPATERQVEYLLKLGVQLDIKLNKGQASDLIGLFDKPEPEDIEFLKFFKKDCNGINQTRARYLIEEITADKDNIKAWDNRSLSIMEKAHMRWFGGKVGSNVGRKEYEQLIEKLHTYEYDEDDVDDMAALEHSAKWDLIESFMEEQSDRDFRDGYDMKKIPLTKVIEFVKKMEKPVIDKNGIELFDSDELAELLLEAYPEYQC